MFYDSKYSKKYSTNVFKQRITGLDLQILTAELSKEILNYRLQNIYNVASSSRQFLLKFSIPDSKKVVVLDCGNKLHLTEFDRPTTQTPSNFVTKLRKHLKTRRLSQIKQIDNDRILVLEFSDGLFYLVLEFFSAGNILLLDENRKILSLQRMVNDKGGNDRYAVNEIYKMFDDNLLKTDFKYERNSYSVEQIQGWIQAQREKLEQKVQDTKTKKKAKVFSIHKLLFVNCSHLSSDLVQINLIKNGILSSVSCFDFDNNHSNLELIVQALEKAEDEYINLLQRSQEGIAGYIVSKKNHSFNPDNHDSTNDLEYIMDEFYPYKPYKADEESYKFSKVDGYNKTLDTFFSTIESTKYALKIDQQKQQAHKRLDYARHERDKQIQSLVAQQELNIKKGDTIMYYADLVDLCKESIVKLIDQQMDWTNIESLIELEQSRGNKIARLINLPLNLKENKINLHLPDMDEQNEEAPNSDSSSDSDSDSDTDTDSSSESELEDESDTDSEKDLARNKRAKKNNKKKNSTVSVWIDISLSSFANARLYFESKKSAESKQIKVEKNTEFALKNAQKKIEQDLKNKLKSENETLKQIRPKYWFEKFFWFVSSEGYLCLAGRDNSQIDMIYYRHFNDNDFFVSSDIEGSLKVFIKNPFKGESIPPSTLMQAGIFSISASSAWNGKVTTSAWVLHGTDISKKDFDGSLISSGNFNYKNKKSYLPPCQLVMGFGFYWLGDEETSTRYRNARLSKEQEHGLKIVMDNKKQDLEQNTKLQEIIQPDISGSKDDQTAKDGEDLNDGQGERDEVEKNIAGSESSNKGNSPEVFPESKDGKKRLSARERRMLRKGKEDKNSGKDSVDENDFDPIAEELKNLKIEEAKNKASESAQKPPNVRGKKAKMKKIATKYADQDEEERRIRMEALGTLKQVEAEKLKEAENLQKNDLKTKYTNDALNAERRRNQEEREYRKYVMEEANEDESSATNYLEILDSFISKPHTDDVLTNLVPIFGPWSSLSKFKYKVKIQPGSGKKGKCINDTLNYFANRKMDSTHSDADLDWENERELLKNAKPNDLVGAFTVNKVKLMLPGGQEKALKKPVGKKGKK